VRHDREDEVVRVGCAFMLVALVVAFIASLPLIDELVGDVETRWRDAEERAR
jgi:hypothetical protein